MYKFGNEPSRVTVAKVQTFSISPIALWKYWINRFSGCYKKEKEEVSSETSSCGDFVRWYYRLSNLHGGFPQVCGVCEMVKRKSRGLIAYLTERFSHYPMILPISRLISNHILLAPTNTHTHPHSDKSWHA